MRLALIIITLLIILPTNNVLGMETHSVHIEWDFDHNSVPISKKLTAYRLYKDGVKVCQFDYPHDFEGDCEFISHSGLYNFNLTAVFDDKTESLRSDPFPFLLSDKELPKKVQWLITVLSLLLLED